MSSFLSEKPNDRMQSVARISTGSFNSIMQRNIMMLNKSQADTRSVAEQKTLWGEMKKLKNPPQNSNKAKLEVEKIVNNCAGEPSAFHGLETGLFKFNWTSQASLHTVKQTSRL